MKKALLKYALLGVLVYLLAVIALLPASYTYSRALPYLPKTLPLALHDLDGSLWSGRANTLAWRSTPLGALQWKLSPWSLLGGQLALDVLLQDSDTHITSHAVITRDGAITLHNVNARLPAAQLLLFNTGLPIAVDGTIAVDLDEARLPQQGAPVLHGTIVWSRALLVAGQPLKLGDLRLTLQAGNNGGTSGILADSGGPLEINGSVVLDANRTYRAEAKLRARPDADTSLRNSLQFLGRPDGRGYYALRYNGRL
jgi:general secretion pathway protein N